MSALVVVDTATGLVVGRKFTRRLAMESARSTQGWVLGYADGRGTWQFVPEGSATLARSWGHNVCTVRVRSLP